MAMFLVLLLATSCLAGLEIGLNAQDQAFVGVSFTNTYPTAVTMLKWNTPFDDMHTLFCGNMFTVLDNTGSVMRFDGALLKRFPTANDFVVIQPGQTIHTAVNIAEGYQLPQAGEYQVLLTTTITLSMQALDLQTINTEVLATQFQSIDVKSGLALIRVSHATPRRPWEVPFEPVAMAISLKNCNNATRANEVNQAYNYAVAESSSATSCLNGMSSCTSGSCSRYPTWFGACSSNNLQTVKNTYVAISNAWNKGAYADCTPPNCPANTYAYVYASDTTHTIYLCSAFWTAGKVQCAGANNFDLQAGTLNHEMSHFSDVAGTADHQYGTTAAKALANSDPNRAIKNADNVEYFAENC
jgi:peptidyl-Lys metalloendopeptidase